MCARCIPCRVAACFVHDSCACCAFCEHVSYVVCKKPPRKQPALEMLHAYITKHYRHGETGIIYCLSRDVGAAA